MFHEFAPHVYHNEYRSAVPAPGDVALAFREQEVLARQEAGLLELPQIAALGGASGRSVYLFSIDAVRFFLVDWPERMPAGFGGVPLGEMRTAQPQHLAYAVITGHQLYGWYRANRFCGACGERMQHDGQERMMRCPACGAMAYPKICPAVIVALMDRENNKLLCTKYAGRAYTRYALVAGFAEIGEPIEDTVRREVMEEVGLRVKNLRYYKSQPWPFSDTLLFGFSCEVDGSTEIVLDEAELSVGRWLSPEEIPERQDISLTNEMMMQFKQKGAAAFDR